MKKEEIEYRQRQVKRLKKEIKDWELRDKDFFSSNIKNNKKWIERYNNPEFIISEKEIIKIAF